MENRQHHTTCERNVARTRRWLQFRLKWLLVFIAVLAVPLSWLGWKLEEKRRERWAEAELKKFSVTLIRAPQPDDPFADELPPGPAWLRRILGDDFFIHVTAVRYWPPEGMSDDPPLTDAGLIYLRYLPKLRDLWLEGAEVTDAGLPQLYSLSKLESLNLDETKVSANAVAKLRQALPNCKIRHETIPNMDMKHFWSVVDRACHSDLRNCDRWDEQLVAELRKLAPDEIIAWNHIFDDLAARAYAADLWGAAAAPRFVCRL